MPQERPVSLVKETEKVASLGRKDFENTQPYSSQPRHNLHQGSNGAKQGADLPPNPHPRPHGSWQWYSNVPALWCQGVEQITLYRTFLVTVGTWVFTRRKQWRVLSGSDTI